MDNYSPEIVRENIRVIRENIAEACEKYGNAEKTELMAVTKTVPPEVVNWVFGEGIYLLGENRVQEYLGKRESYDLKEHSGILPQVHFIGGLQTNKVKYIIDDIDMIQSVDSLKLAQEINRLAIAHNKVMDVLCEVPITFTQAALGAEIEVPTLDGKEKLEIPEGTQTGRVFNLFGKGIPSINNPKRRGSQRVTVVVETPTHLSKEQKELLRKLEERMDETPKRKKFFDAIKDLFD